MIYREDLFWGEGMGVADGTWWGGGGLKHS